MLQLLQKIDMLPWVTWRRELNYQLYHTRALKSAARVERSNETGLEILTYSKHLPPPQTFVKTWQLINWALDVGTRSAQDSKAAYAAVPATAAALTQVSLFCRRVNHLSTFGYFSNVALYPNAFKADPFGK